LVLRPQMDAFDGASSGDVYEAAPRMPHPYVHAAAGIRWPRLDHCNFSCGKWHNIPPQRQTRVMPLCSPAGSVCAGGLGGALGIKCIISHTGKVRKFRSVTADLNLTINRQLGIGWMIFYPVAQLDDGVTQSDYRVSGIFTDAQIIVLCRSKITQTPNKRLKSDTRIGVVVHLIPPGGGAALARSLCHNGNRVG
jgi:hypothetical protein